jgi:hypothetical protein
MKAAVGNADDITPLKLLAYPCTAPAHNTFFRMKGKEGIASVHFIHPHSFSIGEAGFFHTVFQAVILKPAFPVGGAVKAAEHMIAQKKVQDKPAGFHHPFRPGGYFHSGSTVLGAGRDQSSLSSTLNFHHAHPAGTVRSQLFHMAKGGNLNIQCFTGLQNGGSLFHGNGVSVDFQFNHRVVFLCF